MSKAFEPRIGRTPAKAMWRNRHGLQLESELLDVGNKPIHGGVVDKVMVIKMIKKVAKVQLDHQGHQ